jgi:hypothetical protein
MAISLAILADHGCRVALAPALDFRPTQQAADLCGRAGDCCREDCPFHSTPRRPWFWSLLLSSAPVARLGRQSGLSGPTRAPDLPPLTRGTLLCAARTFLYPREGSDHPTHTGASSPHTRHPIIRKACPAVKAITQAQANIPRLARPPARGKSSFVQRPFHYGPNGGRLQLILRDRA